MAWDILDLEEKAEILSLFPDKQHILSPDTEHARPNFISLLNDDSFRYDCATYTGNLAEGRHDPEWLASAFIAHERRRAGDFDEFLINKVQDDWGVEIPESMKKMPCVFTRGKDDDDGDDDDEEMSTGVRSGRGSMDRKMENVSPMKEEVEDSEMDMDDEYKE